MSFFNSCLVFRLNLWFWLIDIRLRFNLFANRLRKIEKKTKIKTDENNRFHSEPPSIWNSTYLWNGCRKSSKAKCANDEQSPHDLHIENFWIDCKIVRKLCVIKQRESVIFVEIRPIRSIFVKINTICILFSKNNSKVIRIYRLSWSDNGFKWEREGIACTWADWAHWSVDTVNSFWNASNDFLEIQFPALPCPIYKILWSFLKNFNFLFLLKQFPPFPPWSSKSKRRH